MKKNLVLAALLLAPALAFADPNTADGWYTEGTNQYNLGNFDAAVAAFKKGFELESDPTKRPAYLANVAQSYRQAHNCKDAQFFYKRYLALKDEDTAHPLAPQKRADIEKVIAELDECLKQQNAIAKLPPETSPEDNKPKTVATADTGVTTQVKAPEPEAPAKPVFSARVLAGAGLVNAGDLDIPAQGTFALLAGYPIAINPQLTIDVGGAFTYLGMPWETPKGMTGTASSFGVLVDAGAEYQVVERVGLRVDLGLGIGLLSGASSSPFTQEMSSSGSMTGLEVRAALSADIGITKNVAIALTPVAFTYGAAPKGLRPDIGSITRLDFLLGVAFRM